jgi:hypothetical protein
MRERNEAIHCAQVKYLVLFGKLSENVPMEIKLE